MALSETIEVRSFKFSNCNDLQDSLDMVNDELQKVIDAHNKIYCSRKERMTDSSRSKSNWSQLASTRIGKSKSTVEQY